MGIKTWLMSFSPTTLTSAFSSVTLGTALAWYLNDRFNPIIYVITLAALLLAQAGVNLVHDYYDYLSGVDILYRASGFSHRPHPIIDLKLSPRDVITVGYVFLAIAFMAGVYLFTLVGLPVLILAMAGLIIGVGYSIPPLKFHYRGYGEVLAALAMGPLVTWGSYIVQTGIYANPAPLIVGIPNGLFTLLILIGSGALEIDACRTVGKITLVLLVGIRNTRYVVYTSIALMYLAIVISAILHYLPYISLVSLLLIPRTLRLAGPLLSGDENVVRSRWRELRNLWAGPFSVRLILLIIFIVSMIIARIYPPLSI
ncbi:prenyltransferase [Vulcanisaeta distributa]|uniref:UbiA prenyltransferase n=1 Tax=Vulcanisaeta distributa (strain DSM 14429 / JCM 11212 / NBRC 100878 / IC-017) TaxID=572478 RepID=E1QSM0_VULDI|nr:prenyltransferase [Vulcanisaeta distributa]ADN50813.1 UbiA prenyltransferase [Vulcanisaeta distributa DSM 14429]